MMMKRMKWKMEKIENIEKTEDETANLLKAAWGDSPGQSNTPEAWNWRIWGAKASDGLGNSKSIPHCKAGPQSRKMKQKTKPTIKIHRKKEKDDMKLQVTRKWPGCSYQGRVILLMGCSRKCVWHVRLYHDCAYFGNWMGEQETKEERKKNVQKTKWRKRNIKR